MKKYFLYLIIFSILFVLCKISYSQNKKLNVDSLFKKSDTCKYSELIAGKNISQTIIKVNDTLYKRIYFNYIGFTKFEGLTIFRDGNLDTKYGKWNGIRADGSRHERTFNTNGVLDGPFNDYNNKGVLISKSTFQNGITVGPSSFFYNDGKIMMQSNLYYFYEYGDRLNYSRKDTTISYYHNGHLKSFIVAPGTKKKYVKIADSTGTNITEMFYDDAGQQISIKKNGVTQDMSVAKQDPKAIYHKGVWFYWSNVMAKHYINGLGLGIFTDFEQVNGVSLSLIGISENISGLDIAIVSGARGLLKGLTMGVVSYVGKLKGIQIGLFNIAEESDGLQIGIINQSTELHGVQLGLLNFRGSFTIDLYGVSIEERPCYALPLINIGSRSKSN